MVSGRRAAALRLVVTKEPRKRLEDLVENECGDCGGEKNGDEFEYPLEV